jgi:ubiquinone/menaquinone biosynthesis C-methylase UbiE
LRAQGNAPTGGLQLIATTIGGSDSQMKFLEEINYTQSEFGELYDEVPLWSAPFGLLLLDRVPMQRGITVLDVGAGTGFLTVEMAQRCGLDATVIAVDPWEAAIRRLRRKVNYLALPNVRLVQGDAATVDLTDSSVDVIVSNLGINNFENADAVLRMCFRVAKPDAKLLLTTNLVGHMHEFYDVFRATILGLGLSDRLDALDAHINSRGTVKSVTEMLLRAGFELLDVAIDSFRMRFADGSSLLRHHFIRLAFVQGWKSVVPDDSMKKAFEVLEQKLNALAADHGELALTIPIACFEARKPGEGKSRDTVGAP